MIRLQDTKVLLTTPPVAAVNNANTLTTTIDTVGFDYCTVLVGIGVSSSSGISALKIQESDYSNMSGAADVTGLVYGTSTDIAGSTSALPVHTNDNTVFAFEIDLKARKRYLDLVCTVDNAGTGAFVTCMTILGRPEQSPTTLSAKGLTGCLRA